jgi:deoxyribodipyrimidine photo-lyase
MKQYKHSLFIFHRDLRIIDNTALNKAANKSEKISCCFIFDENQIKNNEYFSENSFSFMIESLIELKEEIEKRGGKLNFFNGKSEKVVDKILKENDIDAVYFNRDYTPFASKRDILITNICNENNVNSFSFHDALINYPGKVTKEDGGVYSVFTPFYKKSITYEVLKPKKLEEINFQSKKLISAKDINEFKFAKVIENKLRQKGGRSSAIKILKDLNKFKNYNKERDFPAKDIITHLSAHNKFGTVSIREVYYKIKESINNEALIRQLYWRDFYTQIAFFFPHVFGENFREKYNSLKWSDDKEKFEKWKKGETGFPIVDAGMRELNESGFIHNRVRLVVASFLIKDLDIDWRKGEKYFATKLVDYDPSVNNGNWQWVAGTGTDAQPYFRVFNPWSQQKRFDPECKYIKKWIPKLREYSAKEIHKLEKENNGIYFEKIVEHKPAAKKAIEKFKEIN